MIARAWDYAELGAQYPVTDLATGLRRSEPIRYRTNGNRAASGKAFVNRVERAMAAVGVTRVADISHLAASNYPVFQTSRPALLHHPAVGQNTGAQGKGRTRLQAMLSAMMEALEGYCAEARAPHLIRASHRYLANHHLLATPSNLLMHEVPDAHDADSPLMWTQGYCLQAQLPALVPAEAAYFPFFPRAYDTPCLFPCGTNGLASGSTYLEAVIHALYEVIERHYITLFSRGALHVEALYEQEVPLANGRSAAYEVQLFTCELRDLPRGKKNLPVVACVLAGDGDGAAGFGCSGNVAMSIERAVSEAYQGLALNVSGAREDLDPEIHEADDEINPTVLPTHRSLRLADYRRRVHDRTFADLQDEYRFVMNALASLGVQRAFAVNLTRRGVDIPVVKVIAESLLAPSRTRRGAKLESADVTASVFPSMRTQRWRR